MTGDDGFLERWSRRKVDERKPTPTPDDTEPSPGPSGAEDGATGAPPPSDPAPISEEDLAALPPIETLTAESDLRAFLRPGVPSALKNAAMRRMWMLTPTIRDHKDCAVDYAWDWNTPGGVPGNGGRLDAASVQKMLKALTDPAPDPEPRQGVEPDAASPADPAPPPEPALAPTRCAEAAPKAEPGAAPGITPDTSPGRQAGGHPDPETETPVRIRHGGAMPS